MSVLAPLLLATSLVSYTALVFFAAVGIRGTDQYWYAGDIRMIDATGSVVTNHLYPSFTLAAQSGPAATLPPPIHNLPVTRLVSVVHDLGISDYQSWVTVNVFLGVLAAALLYVTARILDLGAASCWAPALFISFPLTQWLSLNALSEMALALAVSVILSGSALAERRTSLWGVGLVAVGVVFLIWSRENFVLVLPSFLLYCVWLWRRRGMRLVVLILPVTMVLLLAGLRNALFPHYPTQGLVGTLMLGAPGAQSTMDYLYRDLVFSTPQFAQKLLTGLLASFTPSGLVELLTELPVVLAAAFSLWALRRERVLIGLRYWVVVFSIIYVATFMVFQTQNRYIYVLVPAVCLASAAAIGLLAKERSNVTRMRLAALAGGMVMVFLAGSGVLAWQYRKEATVQAAVIQQLSSSLETQTSGPLLAVGQDVATMIPIAYAALPRSVLVVDSKLNSVSEASDLLRRWKVTYVLGGEGDLEYLQKAVDGAYPGAPALKRQGVLPTPGGDVVLWATG